MQNSTLYEKQNIRSLFNEMSKTYGFVNLISSFGFTAVWRKKCVKAAKIQKGQHVLDMMTGMGELFGTISGYVGQQGKITGVDIAPEMCRLARDTAKTTLTEATVEECDILENSLPSNMADAVVSSFGLKTFSVEQIKLLAQETSRLLKPGGKLSFVEISVPSFLPLRALYLFYLRLVIPAVGAICLGNPANYRLLGVYTSAFGSCERVVQHFTNAGLIVEPVSYFFGCATGIVGRKS